MFFLPGYGLTQAHISDNGKDQYGAIIGMDCYGSGGRISQINNNNGVGTPTINGVSYDYRMSTIPWGSGSWQHLTMTWHVPSLVYYDNFGTVTNVFGQAYEPCAIIAWIQGMSSSPGQEGAAMYVYGAELYINA